MFFFPTEMFKFRDTEIEYVIDDQEGEYDVACGLL